MQYSRLFAASTLLLGYALLPANAQQTLKNASRVLAIQKDDNGYGGFRSLVINSRAQYDLFKKTVEGQAGWNDRAKFFEVLDQARINFDSESLVLIRQSDGSSSMSVSLASPQMRGDTLTCTVRVTGTPRNRDVVYRCFALAVDRRKVHRVEVLVKEGISSRPRESLVVGK
jgi:hypothetical protein